MDLPHTDGTPLIVGIGGTVRPESSSEAALRTALAAASRAGAQTVCLAARDLSLPFYDRHSVRTSQATRLIELLRAAHGVIFSSPGYHGGISGLVKNAIDYAEDLAQDPRPYLSGLPVGCIGVAHGKQGAVAALEQLRSVAHALRGFATPYGAAIVATHGTFLDGRCAVTETETELALVGTQVAAYAGAPRSSFEHAS